MELPSKYNFKSDNLILTDGNNTLPVVSIEKISFTKGKVYYDVALETGVIVKDVDSISITEK